MQRGGPHPTAGPLRRAGRGGRAGPSEKEMTMAPIETVQQIYAAFGRGDVPFILSQLADDVEWE